MDAESFGPEALSEVQILEKMVPAAIPATPKPQPVPAPGYYFDVKFYIQKIFSVYSQLLPCGHPAITSRYY